MTATLTPITNAQAPLTREVAAPLGGAAPLRVTVPTDTAQALRPVDPVSRPADLRLQAGRDRPVGPPPAFDINVLDEIREGLGAPKIDDRVDDDPPREAAEPTSRADLGYPADVAAKGAGEPVDDLHHLDLKV